MKKLSYIFFASLFLTFVSCDMNDKNAGRLEGEDPQSGWVQFDPETPPVDFVYGQQSEILLPVDIHAPSNKSGLEVNYSITDVSGNSSAIIPERTGKVTIFKDNTGKVVLSDNLVVKINNDAGLTENAVFDITLTSTNRSNVSVGLSDNSKPIVTRVRICSFNISTDYIGSATASVGVDGPAFDVVLVPVAGTTNQFSVTSAWGINMVPTLCNCATRRDYPAIITVNEDYTVTVTGNDPTRPTAYPGGEGTYDPCTDTFRITLRQGIFAPDAQGNRFTVDVVYSPAP